MTSPATATAPGAIDFTVPDELKAVLARIEAYVREDVLPAKLTITDPDDILASWLETYLRPLAEDRTRCCFAMTARECLKLAMQGESTVSATGAMG